MSDGLRAFTPSGCYHSAIMVAINRYVLPLLLFVACATQPPEPRVRILLLGPAVPGQTTAAAVDEVSVSERPSGLVPRIPTGGALEALDQGEELYFKGGELDAAYQALEAAFARLEGHPEWLPADAAGRAAVYRHLLALYRLRVERGGHGTDLADWLARHMTDQDPSVLRVPPLVEAALSGRRDAVRGSTALLTVEVRDPGEWEVYVDGRRVGTTPLRRTELPAGFHAVEVRKETEASWVRHRILEPGENHLVIEPGLDQTLVLEEGQDATIDQTAALPLKIRAVGWLTLASGAEAARLLLDDGSALLVVPGGGFVRPITDKGISLASLRPPGEWRPWTALGLAVAAAAAGTASAILAAQRNQEVRDLNAAPFFDTRPRIQRLEAVAWGTFSAALGLALGAGSVGLWHLLDQGHPALVDLPPHDHN